MALPSSIRAVVTGAGSGLGRAFCLQLAARGARVLAADIRLEDAQKTVELARGKGGEQRAFACDVSDIAQMEQLTAEAERWLGGVDLLVNNAGVAVAGEIGEIPLKDWHWIVGVNLWGVVYGCQLFVPLMKRQKSGHIINVASLAGIACAPTMGPYNATKAAVIALSETLRGELDPHGIGVTVLCPSFFPTNILNAARTQDQTMRPLVEKLMQSSRQSADDVARLALEAAESGNLYMLPQIDAKLVWRIKRLIPQAFHGFTPKLLALRGRLAAGR